MFLWIFSKSGCHRGISFWSVFYFLHNNFITPFLKTYFITFQSLDYVGKEPYKSFYTLVFWCFTILNTERLLRGQALDSTKIFIGTRVTLLGPPFKDGRGSCSGSNLLWKSGLSTIYLFFVIPGSYFRTLRFYFFCYEIVLHRSQTEVIGIQFDPFPLRS